MHKTLKCSLIIALITGLAVLATQAFQWDIAERYTSIGIAALQWLLGYMLLASILLSLFAFVVRLRKDKWRAGLPLILNAITLLLAVAIPWTSLYLDYEWWHNERGYGEVVSLVQSGRLKPAKGSGGVALPARLSGLTPDGTAGAEGTGASLTVFFTTFQGILGHFSGYVYVAGRGRPALKLKGEWDEVTYMKPHWYFVAAS